jgi:hypothetical protein
VLEKRYKRKTKAEIVNCEGNTSRDQKQPKRNSITHKASSSGQEARNNYQQVRDNTDNKAKIPHPLKSPNPTQAPTSCDPLHPIQNPTEMPSATGKLISSLQQAVQGVMGNPMYESGDQYGTKQSTQIDIVESDEVALDEDDEESTTVDRMCHKMQVANKYVYPKIWINNGIEPEMELTERRQLAIPITVLIHSRRNRKQDASYNTARVLYSMLLLFQHCDPSATIL